MNETCLVKQQMSCMNFVDRELVKAELELEEARSLGRELRFPKEKREILLLAQGQLTCLA